MSCSYSRASLACGFVTRLRPLWPVFVDIPCLLLPSPLSPQPHGSLHNIFGLKHNRRDIFGVVASIPKPQALSKELDIFVDLFPLHPPTTNRAADGCSHNGLPRNGREPRGGHRLGRFGRKRFSSLRRLPASLNWAPSPRI